MVQIIKSFCLCNALLILVLTSTKGQNFNDFTNNVSTLNITNTIDTLTSNFYHGRGVENSMQVMEYLTNEFKKFGLSPIKSGSYSQEITPFVYENYSDSSYIRFEDIQLKIKKDFLHSLFDFKNNYNKTSGEIVSKTIFIGEAHRHMDSILHGVNVKNKIVVYFNKKGISSDIKIICKEKGALGTINILNSHEEFEKYDTIFALAANMTRKINLHYKNPKINSNIEIFLSPDAGANLLGIKKNKLKNYTKKYNSIGDSVHYQIPHELKINLHREKKYYRSGNVIGYLQGTDTCGGHIILSAHYDHIGTYQNGYYPGANDNASGISCLLESARILSAAYNTGIKPKKNIIFIAFGLEESRLLGSDYYVNHPEFPLEKLKANINLDMIGRQDKYHDTISNYIYALGPDSLSLDLKNLINNINDKYNFVQLEFLKGFPNANEFFSQSSDQFNFLKRDIPAVLITNGMQKDLHQPSDTKEKLKFSTIRNVTKLLLYTVWELANTE